MEPVIVSWLISRCCNKKSNTSSDTFNINVNSTSAIAATYSVNGGTLGVTTNTLTGPDLTNAWSNTVAKAGTLGNITFTNITNITGGSGTDTLTGPVAGATWNVTSVDAGNINTTDLIFTSIENVTGSASSTDTFILEAGGQITGTLSGGSGGTNSLTSPDETNAWTLTGANAGNINPATAAATTFSNISSGVGGSGTHTVTGPRGTVT